MRGYRLLPVLAVTAVALTACAPLGEDDDVDCPAVAYSNTARLTLSEPRSGLLLELSREDSSEPDSTKTPVEFRRTGDQPLQVVEETGVDDLTGDSATGWTAQLVGAYPTLLYRIIDDSRTMVAEGSVEVDWVQVGGTPECGGPMEADITLPG
ncbi:hypothetical protein [Agromyces indicus]|uniref:Uncharacterized protein n=1 Tax=Agromyces indicus TaxID=758919 RepID=A0ABU1FP41_9MICO|nr:hypothetical protein [Agromyces indicus]MDR5693045.1 hypothetical protein [Agromyces indicus]